MTVRLPARRGQVIAVVAGTVVVLMAVSVWLLTSGNSVPARKVATATVRLGDLTVTASAAGTVQPVNSRALTFGTSGTIETLAVKAGDHVTAGELLATIDPTDAQAAVTSAQSALDAANTNLALAQQQAASPAPTATCPTGVPGATCSPGGGGGGGGGRQQSNTGTDALLRAQQAANNAELALEQAQAKLAGTTILAPITGRVLSVAGAVGQTVSAGGSGFIVLGGTDSLAVLANFSEADVAGVAVGQKATVTLANHPGKRYAATVTQIDPAGTVSGQLVRYGVQLSFVSVPADLLLGQSADVAVTTASATNVLYVPTAAVTPAADGTATVVVRTPTGDVTRPVTIGLESDAGTEIRSGLNQGDLVVISG